RTPASTADNLTAANTVLMSGIKTTGDIIYETTDTETITQGVTHQKIVRFTKYGWLTINILRADLTDKYVNIDTMSNTETTGKLTSVKNLATQASAVAGVNASFFSYAGNSTGYSIGPTVKSGTLISSSSDFNKYGDTMASFSLDKLNKAFYDYFKTSITITAPTGVTLPIARYNKTNGTEYVDFSIFDSKWGTTSIGASETYPDIVEMVVVDGKVSQILASQPAVSIPANGYVVVTRSVGGKQLTDNFKVGDAVVFSNSSTPDWNSYKMSLTGSAMLIKDGQIPATFSYNASDIVKASPKTAVGTSQDGKQLILVAVDGRQDSSIGLTLLDMAKYMKALGAYNAINMDGGGSTTMVGRKTGNLSVETFNSPSDGRSRGIATALGIFSTAPAAELSGLVLSADDTNVFVNTSRSLTLKGYDKYINPIAIDSKSVKWTVTGVKGTFKDNTFYPTTYGEGKITASIGKIKTSMQISVLSAPSRITISNTEIKLPVGKSKTFTVRGYNKNGYGASINPVDVKWALSSKIGTVDGTGFTATARGSGYIDANVGIAHAYCAVSVSQDITTIKDQFEATNGTFLSYPDTVKGSYEISTEQFHSGKASGKLTYDFSDPAGTRAAYLVLPNGGLTLEAGSSKVGLWVYNDHESSNWLRVEITDAKGAKHLVDLVKNLVWTGWQFQETAIEDIPLPAKLTRIYLAQVNPVADNGSVYFDDLQVINSGYPAIDYTKIPADTLAEDAANKAVSFKKATSTSFRFGVFGQSHEAKDEVQKLILTKFAAKITASVDMALIVGEGNHQSISGLIKKKTVFSTITEDISSTKAVDYKYSYKDVKNSRFFKMDIRKNSLRLSDSGQWQQFLADLNSYKGQNVFIMLENSPSNFSDELELKLFKETLTEYKKKSEKNIWVFYKGSKNIAVMDRGVKYISTAGYDVDGLTAKTTDPAQYCLVTVKGSTVTYTFRPVISK
ncbi:MAG: phosphodiester glycosidase family protein, partial [Clostridiales bacterium]|nr:phosphodiester glycosidase family protein [Clostridiales bacterium]